MKFLGGVGHGPGSKWLNFGDDPDHHPDPGVRNPDSWDYRKSYQRNLKNFFGEVEYGLVTKPLPFCDEPDNYLHLGESEVLNLDSPDYRKHYQWILMIFLGEVEYGLGARLLHYGDDLDRYPDPGESEVLNPDSPDYQKKLLDFDEIFWRSGVRPKLFISPRRPITSGVG